MEEEHEMSTDKARIKLEAEAEETRRRVGAALSADFGMTEVSGRGELEPGTFVWTGGPMSVTAMVTLEDYDYVRTAMKELYPDGSVVQVKGRKSGWAGSGGGFGEGFWRINDRYNQRLMEVSPRQTDYELSAYGFRWDDNLLVWVAAPCPRRLRLMDEMGYKFKPLFG